MALYLGDQLVSGGCAPTIIQQTVAGWKSLQPIPGRGDGWHNWLAPGEGKWWTDLKETADGPWREPPYQNWRVVPSGMVTAGGVRGSQWTAFDGAHSVFDLENFDGALSATGEVWLNEKDGDDHDHNTCILKRLFQKEAGRPGVTATIYDFTDKVCVSPYHEIWYGVRILGLTPPEIEGGETVIDFGPETEIEEESMPRIAFTVYELHLELSPA